MELEKIIKITEELIQKYNPNHISPFPFKVLEQDIKELRMVSLEINNDAVSGAIIFDPKVKDYTIIVNNKKSETRQYFTIAHELGHYFLHTDILSTEEMLVDEDGSLDGQNILFRLDDATSNRIETEANNFAANLIMPKDLVEKAWSSLKMVEDCANVFNVSVSAMSIRLERLKLLSA